MAWQTLQKVDLPIHIEDLGWTTKSTLGAVMICQSLLDGVKALSGISQTFDGRDLHTVTGVQLKQTLRTRHHAIPFRTLLLLVSL